ncbi:MAG: hypothetical protein HN764_08760 [Gammaproteobacteria bacterium]|jgi:hypothetical protein|nr:hypothetical protein [Gammaproteobacteria bacterium]
MVDLVSFDRLSNREKNEFKNLAKEFRETVKDSSVTDGVEFKEKFRVKNDSDHYFMISPESKIPFAGIKSKSKKVIETLLLEAYQNY